MKQYAFTSLCALALAACVPPEPEIQLTEGTPLIIGHSYTMSSDVLGMDRRITIRLPQGWMGYDDGEDRTYPVLYVIDGGPEQDFPHLAGLTQIREINDTFSPVILVGIETVNRRHQITPPATDIASYEAELSVKPGGSAAFRDFLRDELKPWVEARYRTSGRDAVMGESLAGLFIVESLMEDPELFDDYIAVNPSLWWDDMTFGVNAAERLPQNLNGKRLYLTSAEEGYRHEIGIQALVEALDTNRTTGLLWSYFALAGSETHGSAYHGVALDALRDLFPQTVQFGRAGPLLSGAPKPDRTAEDQRRIDTPCTLESAERISLKTTYENPAGFAYRCLIQDYGPKPTAGNMPLPFVE